MKKITLYFLASLFVPFLSFSQTKESPVVTGTNKVVTQVEKEATFPGGAEGWKRYLEANLKAGLGPKYIKLKKDQPEATQTVRVQFVIDTGGNVTNPSVENADEVHPKLAAEAIRVIKEGPRWQPAYQNGRKVLYQAKQYITFLVSRE